MNPFVQEDKMNHVKKLNQYFKELARTYNLFFKSAPLIATCVLLLVVMVPQSISYYRIQQQSFETMVERSKNARYLHYYSSLLLDRRDAKEVRLFNMFPKIIKKYTTLFEQTKRDVNQIRKKQLAVSSAFVLLTVGVFGYGFYWFTNSVRTGALEVGVLLMFVSVIGYISTSMARVVEDAVCSMILYCGLKSTLIFLNITIILKMESKNFLMSLRRLKLRIFHLHTHFLMMKFYTMLVFQ